MYQFLCLFGPGVLSWLIDVQCTGMGEEKVEKDGVLLAAAKAIAYSLLDLAATAVVCRPFGRMQFAVLPDGTLTVHYGASALAVAAGIAVVLGLCAAFLKKRSMALR
ncbi:MAG: hypothetical protein K2N87_12955 [Eubacterium sp.]|nr:hypothetical protein [Eubacterium sp.]